MESSTTTSPRYAVKGRPSPDELAALVTVIEARARAAAAAPPERPTRRGWPIWDFRRRRGREES